jgi:DNA recombination protein RmuC
MTETIVLTNPLIQIGAAALALLFLLLWMEIRASQKSTKLMEPLSYQISALGQRVQSLGDGQERLAGGLHPVSEAQTGMMEMMEKRLIQMQQQMTENLQGSARRTAHSLGELQQRLSAIDKAQENITKLSGNVLSLQDILSNKQTRGAFGEIQLNDIVTKALPSDSYTLQATLSNGRRADCLIHLPNPPGPISVDSKFPLEAYEAIRNAISDREVNEAAKLLRTAVRKHIKDISEKYIIEG